MTTFVFDLEGDSLTPTKIWCIGCQDVEAAKVHTTTSYEDMRKLFSNKEHTFIAHNGKRFDVPVIQRLLDIKIEAKVIDTLFLSWVLEPNRPLHGLDSYGDEAGIPKPKIDDWENLSIEEYLHRVEEDVKINMYVWKKQLRMLRKLYDNDMEEVNRYIDFLMFHADQATLQEKIGWKLDVERCKKGMDELAKAKDAKHKELEKHMPKVPVYKTKSVPKRDKYKISGGLCADWVKWYELLEEHGLPMDTTDDVRYISGHKEPNAGSIPQLKAWCYSLGWLPSEIKYERSKKTGEVKEIPQLRVKTGEGPELAPCVALLLDKEPSLELIADLGVITHRISVLNGFLNNVNEEGYVQAQMQGFTNTLRWKHRVVLNLPGVDKLYGELCRGCLIAPDGYELCGSDMCAIEDRTKQHFMWPHDPDYVKEMLIDDFDPHLDLAAFAGKLTAGQVAGYKLKKNKIVGAIRKVYKSVNYACTYGAQGPTVARTAGVPEREGHALVKSYWKRNWSIEVIAEEQVTKRCNGLMWLYNPVSKFWYYLKHKKDIFSTLNQGTAGYCFNMWEQNIIALGGPPIIGNVHDEVICLIRKVDGAREKCESLLFKAIEMVNEQLKLNRDLAVDAAFGDTYADIH
jgi:DNA polymerase III epsilon subunit-like protein